MPEDAGRDVHGDAADVGAEQFTFAGVNRGADLDPQLLRVRTNRLGAADRLRRAIEGDQVTVAGALHHRAAEPPGELPADLTEALQQRTPPFVTRGDRTFGGCDDVREQHRAEGPVRIRLHRMASREELLDAGQDGVGFGEPRRVVG